MADNIDVTPGTGKTVAADEVGGVLFQRIKPALGADGTAVDASAGAGAVGTGVQRMTLASDDPAVVSLASVITNTDGVNSGVAIANDTLALIEAVTTAVKDATASALKTLLVDATGAALAVEGDVRTTGNIPHGDADTTPFPLGTGGTANAAAPAAVTEGDRVGRWHLLNGAGVSVLSAAGALVGGDATNGLDVDVTRVPADPFGATADAAVTAGATGSISAKLRSISRDLLTNIVLATNTNLIGKVRPYGEQYETVAASQSAQALGATGATGDYLSHIEVQPTSTTVGVVTVLDNAIEVAAYPGGTVTAALYPFTLPINAVSVSGAWKITTGAGVKCTAYGNFT